MKFVWREVLTIPQEKAAAVSRALHEAFGVTEPEDLRQLSEAGANPVFRIVVRGSAFLLRLNLRAGNVSRHYTCMKAAADAGLAPSVWYASPEDRVSITDFVEARPFPVAEALLRIPAALRDLHALPPFPEESRFNTTCTFLLTPGPAVDGFLQKFREMKLLPPDETDALFAGYEQLVAAYPHPDADRVSSHNDLFKPDNMLFDGRRLWLVDWEAAFRNDRYTDLAVAAHLVVANQTEERAYLEKYFGAPPDPNQQARFYLAQQLSHMFYALVFLFQAAAAGPIDWAEPAPEFTAFQRAFWTGAIKLVDPGTKAVYGRIHWERLRQNLRTPRWHESLRIVSDRYPMP